MTYNVALIVLDTLREDHAQGLEALSKRGFIRYKNAIAPAPWTLPSHVSMFTGLYPSEHGVYGSDFARKSRLTMHKLNYGVIGELARHGYNIHFVTANPYLTPHFGFKANDTILANNIGITKYDPNLINIVFDNIPRYQKVFKYLRQHFRPLLAVVTSHYKSKLVALLNIKQKGGIHILDYISNLQLKEPYFLYINFMESHPPYSRLELFSDIYRTCFLDTILQGRCPSKCYYIRKIYKRHANYAVDLLLKAISRLDDGRTLIIVTSDHGEGLCDSGFGHGYWLTDNLARVPLWVKYPNGSMQLQQAGKYVSLTEIPAIILSALGDKSRIGSHTVYIERAPVPPSKAVINHIEKRGYDHEKFQKILSDNQRVTFS